MASEKNVYASIPTLHMPVKTSFWNTPTSKESSYKEQMFHAGGMKKNVFLWPVKLFCPSIHIYYHSRPNMSRAAVFIYKKVILGKIRWTAPIFYEIVNKRRNFYVFGSSLQFSLFYFEDKCTKLFTMMYQRWENAQGEVDHLRAEVEHLKW